MGAGWQGVSSDRLLRHSKRMKKSSCSSRPPVSCPSSPSCTANASSLLPKGNRDGSRYLPPVGGPGNDDRNHHRAEGICTRMVLALAGRDAMNFWRRPTAALSARTFILSSPARGRGSARRGQPLPTARSRVGRAASGPFTIRLFQGLPKGVVLVWCSAFF